MRRAPENVSVWPTVLATLMLAAALGTLLLLRGRLIQSQNSLLEGTAKRFALTGHLGRPESPSMDFEDLEVLRSASKNELLREIRIVKLLTDDRAVTVVPFHADLTEPNWRERIAWTVFPVGDPVAGYLYMDVNRATVRTVDAAIVLLGLMLAGGMGILLFRQFGTEVRVGLLQGELEERKGQIIQLERLALAGQLSANIFHDIKKPVLNIKHEVNDALDGGEVDTREVLAVIREQTELFLQMLRDLGVESFVNASAENAEWCDPAEIVENSLRLVRYEQEGIRVETRIDIGDFLVQAIPHRLIQLFSNLFLNAYQSMGSQGTLRITGAKDGEGVEFTIEDSGPGIPPEKLEDIFSPFVTSRAGAGGSGLGLYICRTIVEDLGGRITAGKSEELGGARFTVTLPKG